MMTKPPQAPALERDPAPPPVAEALEKKLNLAAERECDAVSFRYWQANNDIGVADGRRWGQG